MIPKAREVRLNPKVRKVLEARCRAPSTAQRDVKRARIVLLAAAGRSTRSIAAEVSVQPRIVSNWRRRFADHGLDGLRDRPRAGKKPIYGKATNKRILALLDKPPPAGYARWTGPLLAKALGDVDVQYVWRFLREHKSPCRPQVVVREQRPGVRGESHRCGRPLCRSARQGHCSLRRRKAFDPGLGAGAGLFEAAMAAPDRPEHDYSGRPRLSQHSKSHRRIIAAHKRRRRSSLGS